MSTQPVESVDPESAQLAGRLTGLLGAQPWMDHQTAVTLAQQPTSNTQMHQTAQTVGDGLAQTWDGYAQTGYDPVLKTQPTSAVATAKYVHEVLGAPAITNDSIDTLQMALAHDGFLDSSHINGQWDALTENAYNKAVDSYKQEQYAGAPKKGGNPFTSTVSGLLHAVFHDVTHPQDLVTGWYDSVAQAVGDLAGAVAGTGDDIAHWDFSSQRGKDLFASVTQHTMNTLTAGNHTQAEELKIHKNPLNAVGDVLSVTPGPAIAKGIGGQIVKRTAEDVGKTSAEQFAKDAAESAAQRAITGTTPEQAAANLTHMQKLGAAISAANRMGFIGRSINDIGDALRAGTLPADHELVQRQWGKVAKTFFQLPSRLVGRTQEFPNLISPPWYDSMPGIGRILPKLQRAATDLADSAEPGGFAYSVRNFGGYNPYRFGPVRALGIAGQRAGIASLAGHAAANLLPGSQLQQNVDNAGKGGAFDSFLDNTRWNVIPGYLSLGPEDLLLGPLHGDLVGAGRASSVIGDAVSHYTNALADKMGHLGAPAAFQDALKLSPAQMLEQAGGDSTRLHTWMNDKINAYASDVYAQRQMADTYVGASAEQDAALAKAREAWYALPAEQRAQWVADTAKADPHYTWLRNRIQGDLLRNTVDPKAAMRQSMEDFFTNTKQMQDLHKSGAFNYLLNPRDYAHLAERDAAQDPDQLGGLTHSAGALGLQKTSNFTREEVLNQQLPVMEKALDDAPTPELKEAAIDKMVEFLHTRFNMDASQLHVFDRNPSMLVQQIKDRAEHLASEVLPTHDQPEWVAQRLAALKANGYRVVVGSHIGHVYDGTLPDFGVVDGWKSPIRQWVGKAGLDPQRVPDVQVGKAIQQNMDAKVHQFLTNTKARLATPHADFRTVRAVVSQDAGWKREAPLYARTAMALTSKVGLNKTEISRIMADTGKTEADARAQLEDAVTSQYGIRDISRNALVNRLKETHDVQGPHGTFTWNGVGDYTARGIVNALHDGYRLPGYMMGLEQIENWARAGFGIGPKLIERNPDNPLYRAVNNWPDKLVRARNTLRFTVSPIFAARVATKQRYKAALEGVRIPFNPLAALEKDGATTDALGQLTRMGGQVPKEQMDADRYLLSRDIFGIHDSQWDSAYFVHSLKQQGASADDIKSAYERVFKYGTQGGRSSLERSMNTIFFPFSFDKTLLRNTGAYLADRPGQALALDLGVEAWRQADKNGQIGQWVDDHLPILKEMQMLNAFSHGISPGQFGGINAPLLGGLATGAKDIASGHSEALLNMFLPQSWGGGMTQKNLQQYLPVWSQLGKLLGAVADQAKIVYSAAHDTVGQVLDKNWRPMPTLTDVAQQQYALRTKAELVTDPGVRQLIDYNMHQSSDADKYTWPQSSKLPVEIWGKPVDKTTISTYLQYLYPAYNPDSAVAFAKAQAGAADAYIRNVAQTDKGTATEMTQFKAVADQVISHLNRDEYDTATASQVQEQYRQGVAQLAQSNPAWKAFYDKFFAYSLGPLDSPAQKAQAIQ